MRTKVTEKGVLIPASLLEGMEEVDIRKQDNLILITPVSEQDPILGLGQHPVECAVKDASVQHDQYLYDAHDE